MSRFCPAILNLSSADSSVLLGRSGGGGGAIGGVHDLLASTGIAASVAGGVTIAVVMVVLMSTDVARAISVSGSLVVGVVLLHKDGDLGLAQDRLCDLLGNSPVDSDNLVTVLSNGLLNGNGLGNLDSAGNLHGALVVNDLGDSHLNLLDLVGANGHANGVGHHDGLGDHDNLVNVTDRWDLNLLSDGLIHGPVGDDSARNFDGLNVIHGVLDLLCSLARNLDGLGVGDNLSSEGLNFFGAERSVGLLDSVLLWDVGVHSASDLLGDSDAAGGNTLTTVVMGIGNDGAVAVAGNRAVRLGH